MDGDEVVEEVRKRLMDKDEKSAYAFAKQIGLESAESDKYLALIPLFAELLTEKSSYVRTRAFLLICNQARWAANGQIEAVFDRMVPLLHDPKPTVVRQCLGALHEVALYRPEMSECIRKSLAEIDPNQYKDSMAPLIRKDMDALIAAIP